MEQRLIDANAYAAEMKTRQDALKEMMDAARNEENWELYDKLSRPFGVFVEAKLTLDAIPTVDAVQVVHAYWIIKPHGTYGQLRAFCSACGKHSGIGGIVSNQKKPYCPNCGAIMDGKEIVDG